MSANEGHDTARRPRSTSRSRPTTPLRPSSRSSFRESTQRGAYGGDPFPLNAFEPAFAELSDAVADLEANMMHFQLMHESLARFSESFASFLYGLNMNAFCVDFPEGETERGPASYTVSEYRTGRRDRGGDDFHDYGYILRRPSTNRLSTDTQEVRRT
ncbi:DASH complex subunit Dam1-domain-containing protein [Durotheca rogersii]|uniref:DASH complex subunit Dam1-domain-containing protein n=1 Tax=Durotheca rogersii TaxID=419775 RepID=UPI002220F384|nr:DASH complex subunit Dam1-domain-containing protein [Durotheca rogersii]KAI5863585.1 DASH complex subunit Dam1-domain-containing protein [Durotheca rogersii]